MNVRRPTLARHVVIALAAFLTFQAPAVAQDAQADAWAKVTDCGSLAAFRSRYPNSRYSKLYDKIRDGNGQSCSTKPKTKPTPTPRERPRQATRPTSRPPAAAPTRPVTPPRQQQRTPTPTPVVLTGALLEAQANEAKRRNDFVAARDLYRRACYAETPSASGCNEYAFELGQARSGKQDFPTVRANYARGCELLADAVRCDNAWKTALSRAYGPPDSSKAIAFHLRSGKGTGIECKGWAAECNQLALLYEARNMAGDRQQVKLMVQMACQAGHGDACLGASRVNGLEGYGPYNFGAIRDYFDLTPADRRTTTESGFACNTRGFLCFAVAYGLAYPTTSTLGKASRSFDYGKAAVFAQASCKAGELRGCNLLGRLRLEGRTWLVNDIEARTHFEKACEIGKLAAACNNVGLAVERGFGRTSRFTAGSIPVGWFSRACNAGDSWTPAILEDWPGGPSNGKAEGCYNRGRAYRDGIEVKRNSFEASASFRKACALGYQQACAPSR